MKHLTTFLLIQFCLVNITIGQYAFTTSGQTYTQDFESFAGTLATVPTNWTNSFNDYSPGGYYSNTGSYNNSLSTYSLNQNGSGEYAFGSKIGASAAPQQVKFKAVNNVSGQNITSFSVNWDVEQYSTGGRATTVDFTFSAGGTISGTTLTTATTGSNANLPTVDVTNRSITITNLLIPFGTTFDFIWEVKTGSGSGDNGHIGIDNITVELTSTVLPILLTTFYANTNNNKTQLSFSTETERNNDYFSIERSINAIRFTEIGQVKGAGDSNEPKEYTFIDNQPKPGSNYYRLKQVDFDGKFSYSKVVSVNFDKDRRVTMSPIPASSELSVTLDEPGRDDGLWQLVDMSGRILRTGVFPAETIDYQINVGDLSDGSYVFRLMRDQEVLVERFLKGN